MKKFYFLNKNKSWQGPYRYHSILLFTLSGTIIPTTYLWHDRLAPDIGDHPSTSIYGRIMAQDFKMLPIWVFGHNLNIVAKNTIKKWEKRLKKQDWERSIAQPIETSTIMENAEEIFLVPSITAIHDFAAPGRFNVKLTYDKRDDDKDEKVSEYNINLTPDKNPGIKFEIILNEPPAVGGVEHMESYGLHKELVLVSENESISVAKDSVVDFSTQFPSKPQILRGRFKQANLIANHNYKNRFNRLILKMNDDKIIEPLNIVASTGRHKYDHDRFNVHKSLMGWSFKTGGGYSECTIDGRHYVFYSIDGSLLVIDGQEKEDLAIFKQKAEVIRIALALISGKFLGGICNYITSDDCKFKVIDGIWYELERGSIISNRRVIDLQFFRSTFKETNKDFKEKYYQIDRPVNIVEFSALCETLWSKEDAIHAANLIISGMGNSDPLQQGALYSVALETLTTVLGKSKSKELKPIPENEISKAFVVELQSVLSNYKDKISDDGFRILSKNIEGVNKPTNRDKLVKTFELYGIILSDKDKETINKRNDYLHGRNPLKHRQTFELTQISLRLHTLIVALLLKSVGYAGHVINLDSYIYITDEKRMSELTIEYLNIYERFVEEMSQALLKRDQDKICDAKNELRKFIENDKLADLIRIL